MEELILTEEQIQKLPSDARKDYRKCFLMLREKKNKAEINNDFLKFVKTVWPDFIQGDHHKKIADQFNRLARGDINRLIINMPPRHTKSEFASFLLPAWMIGKNPKLKIIQTTHTAELAVRFGRKAKTLIDSEDYQKIFQTRLREDSQAAGRWETEQGGEYFAAGVGGAITGRGADLLIIDDPHSEQEAAMAAGNPDVYDKVYEWYTSGPRQRLQPGGAIVVVMTRWGTKDLAARLIKQQASHKADKWEVIEFPAILPSGKPLWPGFWSVEELLSVKASLSPQKWQAQWQQQPSNDEGAILKREWWQVWQKEEPPIVEYIMQSYDTAYSKKETADYSVITTWGVFTLSEVGHYNYWYPIKNRTCVITKDSVVDSLSWFDPSNRRYISKK